MKDNRGFTLVELLAVIALIAVLSVVAVSTYRGINESSKQKTLEAKISQIESAAEKWARENNITNRMNISVNTLVVEGYLSADEANTDGLAMLKNPVTGENMICNTVDITFKDGIISSKFNSSTYNCKLASQSLVDSNIKIRVVSSTNDNLTGTGSIAKWTNKDVLVIVNSDKYDAKATSISYDFEGTTIIKNKENLSKYTGTNYITEAESAKYYNVYYISSGLLINTNIVVTYDIPGEGTKSRFYTIRFDKEEATATIKSNSEWVTEDSKVQITVDDGKGSGIKGYYISQDPLTYSESSYKTTNYSKKLSGLAVGKYYVWTVDNADNTSSKYKLEFEINNVDKVTPGCEVLFHGTEGNNGWFISNVTPGVINNPVASVSGVNIGGSLNNTPTYSGFAAYQTQTEVPMAQVTTETTKAGINYYCFAKSLAGKTGTNSRNLKIDKTPPTVTVHVNNANTYTQQKYVTVTITDNLSGVNRSSSIKMGLSTSTGTSPSEWIELSVAGTNGNNQAVGNYTTTFEYTGDYYVWIDASAVTDYAGNHTAQTYYQSGLIKLDNTPPTCEITNITNQCTTTGLSFIVACSDGHSGVASCAGTQSGVVSNQIYTVLDQAGNSNTCSASVSSTTQYNKQNCSEYHKYRCNCGWTEAANNCWQTDTYESHDTATERVGCTGCYDYSTCRKSYQCCKSSYVCQTCTDYTKCDSWGTASA